MTKRIHSIRLPIPPPLPKAHCSSSSVRPVQRRRDVQLLLMAQSDNATPDQIQTDFGVGREEVPGRADEKETPSHTMDARREADMSDDRSLHLKRQLLDEIWEEIGSLEGNELDEYLASIGLAPDDCCRTMRGPWTPRSPLPSAPGSKRPGAKCVRSRPATLVRSSPSTWSGRSRSWPASEIVRRGRTR